MSENPRPASTPPTLASGEKEQGEEEKIAAELEVNEIWIVHQFDYTLIVIMLLNQWPNCTL